jgi:hypothetical protein
MRNFKIFLAALLLAAVRPVPGRAQTAAGVQASEPAAASYNPAGRRDPFKNLLAGKDLAEKRVITGLSDLMIDEIMIIGIVKARDQYEAVIGMASGFPMSAHEGDRFVDGYVLSIRDGEVILRKTKERGVPLLKPKDIIKEITSEER